MNNKYYFSSIMNKKLNSLSHSTIRFFSSVKSVYVILFLLCSAFLSPQGLSAQNDAHRILEQLDKVLNAPADISMQVRATITDRRGRENVRELSIMQKGSDKRMVKFLSPADQKGIGFLSLPGDNLTLFMPAYGRTRRIGGHVKNSKFAGTDYTYEDMEAKRYSEKYTPKLIQTEADVWVIELTPKQGARSEYSKLEMTVRKSDYYPAEIKYFDKGGNPLKILKNNRIEKTGKYTLARETIMTDLKTNTNTKMEIVRVEFDAALGDELFSERFLIR